MLIEFKPWLHPVTYQKSQYSNTGSKASTSYYPPVCELSRLVQNLYLNLIMYFKDLSSAKPCNVQVVSTPVTKTQFVSGHSVCRQGNRSSSCDPNFASQATIFVAKLQAYSSPKLQLSSSPSCEQTYRHAAISTL